MANTIPVKAIFSGANPVALGEFENGDVVPIENGGTGASDAASARLNLGVSSTQDVSDHINNVSVHMIEYVFHQDIPSMTWTVNHNLSKYPHVIVFDSAGDRVWCEVKYVDENTFQVRPDVMFSGLVRYS